jgi:hypothetical protein
VPPAPRPAPIKQGLGLGLGLGPKQRAAFSAAAKQGQGSQWLANRPGIQGRIQGVNPTSGQANRIQQFMGSGQSQRPNMPRPPVGQPQRGSGAGLQRPRGQTQPLGASVPGYGGVNPGMQSVIDSRTGGMQVPAPDQGWSGDNASQLGAQAGGYAIGSGEQGPSFGPGGPYGGGGFPPRDLGDLHGMLGGGSAMQPVRQQRPGGMYGGLQPMSGYGGNAYGSQMGGALGSFNRPMPGYTQQGDIMVPNQSQAGGGFGSFGGGGGPRDFGQSSYAGPVQQQRPGGMYGGSMYNQGANYGATQYGGGGGGGVPMGAGGVAYPNYNPAQYPAGRPY